MSLATNFDLKSLIRNRRSIKEGYNNKPVSEQFVRDLLNDAIWAPTHGLREPWRFIFVGADAKESFATAIASTYDENLRENRKAYLSEPSAILVVIMEEPKMPKQWDENFGAVASLIQNFSLLAWEQNLGVCWKTNPHIYNEQVKEILGVRETEKIVGFIHLGYFDEAPESQERTAVEAKFTTYPVKND